MDTLLKFLVLVKMVYIVATFVQPGITAGVIETSNNTTENRNEKVLSLFSVVNFPNLECNSLSSSFARGTCLASSECQSKGGTTSGTCAAGFGVCCLFTTSACSSTVSNNVSYITNPGFPSTYNTAGTCTYTVNKISSDICQLRLDFITLVQSVSTNPQGCCGAAPTCTIASDSLTVLGKTGKNPPVICGTNTGEHMYVETGATDGDTVSLAFLVTGTSNDQWNVKVSQIPCSASYRAPSNCVKYFTGSSGTVTSYGFPGDTQLTSQNYESCIRQEKGYCGIQWDESTLTAPKDAFDLTNAAVAGQANTGDTPAGCIASYIQIPNGVVAATTGPRRFFCGETLGVDTATTTSPVTTYTVPFSLTHFTSIATQTATGPTVANGFSLDYTQLPC
ncbi:uncharacterized protein LOC111696274 [Eurytemora carolleeae]|uniref:uncharacterized protein LOC111696274 n=1 Tax=Eurytemora carolleeae TaxID=1294199 RepID=UPI000C789B1F|nr:uncharacterized protein LOC111696274 [Eurytemora carolleeae]|eukprot:XP_023321599.1 uncharacterized protein LOC111696274 [Eurytemora affinis]